MIKISLITIGVTMMLGSVGYAIWAQKAFDRARGYTNQMAKDRHLDKGPRRINLALLASVIGAIMVTIGYRL